MRSRLARCVLIVTVVAAAAWRAGAADTAALDATALVRKSFNHYRGLASYARMRMTIHRPEWERAQALEGWTRGEQDSVIVITEPARDKGNGTLKRGHQMWTFNPRVNRVIKLPPSLMGQSWMGSDFTNHDLAKTDSVVVDYTHSLEATEERGGHTVYRIRLTPTPGAPVVWGHEEILLRDDDIMLEERFYDQEGKLVKTLVASEIQVLGGRMLPRVITMTQAEDAQRYTRMEYDVLEFRDTLPDRLFRRRFYGIRRSEHEGVVADSQGRAGTPFPAAHADDRTAGNGVPAPPWVPMTSDLTLAWRNLRRNRRRTLLSAGGIGFASALLVFVASMQTSQYQLMLRASVNSGTGYLQVQADGYLDEPRMWLVVRDPAAAVARLRDEPRITAVTTRSEGFSLLASAAHAQGALVVGVAPETEMQVSNIAKSVQAGAFLAPGDFDRGVIGALLARNLDVGVGDTVTVLGSARDGSVAAGEVVVAGIIETGQPELDRAMMYVPLAYFDEVFRMEGAVHRVIARCDTLWNLGPIARRVTAGLAGTGVKDHAPVALTWRALLPGVLEAIQLDMTFGGFMFLVLVLVVAFSILNTFVMAVFERTREFGVMMAIGTTPWRLVRVLMLESSMLTLLGIVVGIIVGAIVTLIFADVGIYMGKEAADFMRKYGLPPRIHPELTIWSAMLGPTAVLLLTLGAAAIPALRIRKMRPVEAMRAA